MSSAFVQERLADQDIGRFFREEDSGNFPIKPCDPPDGSGGTGGAELPGEEVIEDYSDPPNE